MMATGRGGLSFFTDVTPGRSTIFQGRPHSQELLNNRHYLMDLERKTKAQSYGNKGMRLELEDGSEK